MGPNFKKLKALAKDLDGDKLDELMNSMKSMLGDKGTVAEEAEKAVEEVKDTEEEPKEEPKEGSPEEESEESPAEEANEVSIEGGDPYIKNIGIPNLPEDVQGVKVSTIVMSDDGGFDDLIGNVGTLGDDDDVNKGGKDSKLSNNEGDSIKKTPGVGFFDVESSTPEICTGIDSGLRNNSGVIAKIYGDWKSRYDDNNWKQIGDSLDGYVTKYVVIDNRINYNNKALKQLANPSATGDDMNVVIKIVDDNIYMQHLLDLALEQIISTEK